MPTTKPRINVTISPDVEAGLKILAKRDRVPVASKAAELLSFALAIEEDQALIALAESRDTADAKYIPHDKFWKMVRRL